MIDDPWTEESRSSPAKSLQLSNVGHDGRYKHFPLTPSLFQSHRFSPRLIPDGNGAIGWSSTNADGEQSTTGGTDWNNL